MVLKFLLRTSVIVSFLLAGIFVGIVIIYFLAPLPDVSELRNFKPLNATKIYDREGRVVAELGIERRNTIPSAQIPPLMKAAFIAAEDARFFSHLGVDIPGIIRALIKDITKMRFYQGGSTITQQLVKLLYLTPEKSVKRKILEMLLAVKVEKKLTKDEILELYLNQIYLGHGSYGIDAASRSFFGKSPRELSLGEISLLAGLPKAPAFYSPNKHMGRALIRRKYVLGRMVEDGYITKYDARIAAALPVKLSQRENQKKGSYFVEYVRGYLLKKYGYDMLYKGGLRVYTTLSTDLQEEADNSLNEWLEKLEVDIHPPVKEPRVTEEPPYVGLEEVEKLQGALISMDIKTGEVLAMVGGRDFSESQFNRAIQSKRQPGSAFKPLIYAAAIHAGFTPADRIDDLPVEYIKNEEENWRPSNYDNKFLGPITLRDALAKSRNLATVRLLKKVGIKPTIDMAEKLGISASIPRDLSISLGSMSLSLLSLCEAYATIGNMGLRPHPLFIREVDDQAGDLLERNKPVVTRGVSQETAYIMTYMLKSVIKSGTGRRARFLGNNLAGKTGTTNDFVDAWFIGFSPRVLTGVWVGFDTPISMGKGKTGAVAALPIWTRYMKKAILKYPSKDFTLAPGIIFARVDGKTGVPTGTQRGIMMPFKLGHAPQVTDGTKGRPGMDRKNLRDDIL